MSYNPIKNEDSLSELISSSVDCLLVCNKILENQNNEQICLNWFHKSMQTDKRFTIFFMRNNLNKMKESEIKKYIAQYCIKSETTMEEILE